MENNAFVPAGILAYTDFLLDPRMSLSTKSAALILKVFEGRHFIVREFAAYIRVSPLQIYSMMQELNSAGYMISWNDDSFRMEGI